MSKVILLLKRVTSKGQRLIHVEYLVNLLLCYSVVDLCVFFFKVGANVARGSQ